MTYAKNARDAFRRDDTELLDQLSRRELARARADGDAAGEIEALGMLARIAIRDENIPEAQRLATDALGLARSSGDRALERTPTHILAGSARILGDFDAARSLLAESIALNESLGETRMVVVELLNLGYIELHTGDLDKARNLFTSARRRTLQGGHEDMFAYVALDTAVMTAVSGDAVLATRWLAAIDRALDELGEILDPDDAVEQRNLRERLREELGSEAYEAAYAAGSSLDIRQLLAG